MFKITEKKLSIWHNKSKIKKLVKALHYGQENIRTFAAKYLNEINWTPSTNLEKVNFNLAQNNYISCLDFGKDAIEPIIKIYHSSTHQYMLAYILYKLSPDSIEAIIRHINYLGALAKTQMDYPTDSSAAKFTALIEEAFEFIMPFLLIGETATNKLLGALKGNVIKILNNAWTTRIIIFSILGRLKTDQAYEVITNELNNKGMRGALGFVKGIVSINSNADAEKAKNDMITTTLIDALGQSENGRAVYYLLSFIDKGSNSKFQKDVINAISEIGKKVVPILSGKYDNANENQKYIYCSVIKNISDINAGPELIDIINSDINSKLSWSAIEVLENIYENYDEDIENFTPILNSIKNKTQMENDILDKFIETDKEMISLFSDLIKLSNEVDEEIPHLKELENMYNTYISTSSNVIESFHACLLGTDIQEHTLTRITKALKTIGSKLTYSFTKNLVDGDEDYSNKNIISDLYSEFDKKFMHTISN